MNEQEIAYRTECSNRLLGIRKFISGHSVLPKDLVELVYKDKTINEREQEWLLFLFYYTAANWEVWVHQNIPRVGLRTILKYIDTEHYDPFPSEFGHDPSFLVIPQIKIGKDWDWRQHTFSPNVMDVEWSEADIDSLEGETDAT